MDITTKSIPTYMPALWLLYSYKYFSANQKSRFNPTIRSDVMSFCQNGIKFRDFTWCPSVANSFSFFLNLPDYLSPVAHRQLYWQYCGYYLHSCQSDPGVVSSLSLKCAPAAGVSRTRSCPWKLPLRPAPTKRGLVKRGRSETKVKFSCFYCLPCFEPCSIYHAVHAISMFIYMNSSFVMLLYLDQYQYQTGGPNPCKFHVCISPKLVKRCESAQI